eukprot:gb/GFBE01063365.1/.p1 GENE.gb/GFBE01063365.1/~~gb/GFBE01063365.1/.p1  ORF type:complete len:267 (+),score=26.33 gb/GFBE01063365.1/:1-801(+)
MDAGPGRTEHRGPGTWQHQQPEYISFDSMVSLAPERQQISTGIFAPPGLEHLGPMFGDAESEVPARASWQTPPLQPPPTSLADFSGAVFDAPQGLAPEMRPPDQPPIPFQGGYSGGGASSSTRRELGPANPQAEQQDLGAPKIRTVQITNLPPDATPKELMKDLASLGVKTSHIRFCCGLRSHHVQGEPASLYVSFRSSADANHCCLAVAAGGNTLFRGMQALMVDKSENDKLEKKFQKQRSKVTTSIPDPNFSELPEGTQLSFRV